MKELKSILTAYQKIDLTKQRAALATVVSVQGSSYRSPGARMLITDDGRWVGSISGGCLEGDALRKARDVMQRKQAITVTYDTREESNQNLGIGLGCNGVIDVLIEPIDSTSVTNVIDMFSKITNVNTPVALATIFSGPNAVGEKLLLKNDNTVHITFNNDTLAKALERDLQLRFETGKSEAKTYHTADGTFGVFVELIQPSISLIIFGGGFDARPVSQLAKSLGWEVMVTDECVAHIAPLFFPTADKLSLCHRDFIDRDFNITPYTACVLMSHNYEYDRDVLRKIIKSNTPYIGILGPRKRFDKMVLEFTHEKITFTAQEKEKIHSPIGLDIGAETPDEIALSIIAEIQGKFANRSGGFLKYRQGPIHKRDEKSDQVFKQIYLNENDSNSKYA
ncbi:XdhC family protein [Pseudochryseolinea flava]|uniref:XdhC/CoxI family protein n=1 Tax=Pseudochryseolinea flava TaxID=2059302 RepID=A0A364XYJ3_9BACT|nr:XdhC family protein [Pseudochryseolinea flava]RAV99350.1 XdhC/CoxI family protein [Pseudochryseolinea flava]